MQKSYEGKSFYFSSVILILLNSEEEKFANTPLYSTDGQGINAEVLVKYFNPCGSGVPKTVKWGCKQLFVNKLLIILWELHFYMQFSPVFGV